MTVNLRLSEGGVAIMMKLGSDYFSKQDQPHITLVVYKGDKLK
jgi:hypothetical protein